MNEQNEGLDPVEAFRRRVEEDKHIQDAWRRMQNEEEEFGTPNFEKLFHRRESLREEIRRLNSELGEGHKHRALLRRLPDWFWIPVSITYDAVSLLTPAQIANGRPTLYHWSRHSDIPVFIVNVLLGIVFMVIFINIFGFVFS